MTRPIALATWGVLIVLFLIGLIHPPIPNAVAQNSTASGWLSVGSI